MYGSLGGPKMTVVSNWYLIYTHWGAEKEARTNLERQSINTLLPLTQELKSRGGSRRKLVDKPFFPRYVFAHTSPANFSPLRSTRGVSSIVSFGTEPVIVPQFVIDEIESRIVNGYVRLDDAPTPTIECPFSEGQHVRIISGARTGIPGLFSSYTPAKQRALIFINILGRQQLVPVDIDELEPVIASYA